MREWNHKWRESNREKYNLYCREYARNRRKLTRQRFIHLMGGVCNCCGFSDWRALQIDHVNGGGTRDPKITWGATYRIHVLNDKTGKYQILCANCNWIKRYDKNENAKPRNNG